MEGTRLIHLLEPENGYLSRNGICTLDGSLFRLEEEGAPLPPVYAKRIMVQVPVGNGAGDLFTTKVMPTISILTEGWDCKTASQDQEDDIIEKNGITYKQFTLICTDAQKQKVDYQIQFSITGTVNSARGAGTVWITEETSENQRTWECADSEHHLLKGEKEFYLRNFMAYTRDGSTAITEIDDSVFLLRWESSGTSFKLREKNGDILYEGTEKEHLVYMKLLSTVTFILEAAFTRSGEIAAEGSQEEEQEKGVEKSLLYATLTLMPVYQSLSRLNISKYFTASGNITMDGQIQMMGRPQQLPVTIADQSKAFEFETDGFLIGVLDPDQSAGRGVIIARTKHTYLEMQAYGSCWFENGRCKAENGTIVFPVKKGMPMYLSFMLREGSSNGWKQRWHFIPQGQGGWKELW